MKSIEVMGKSFEEAVKNGLKQLNAKEEEVDIEVIDAGSKGLFNLIGAKPTKIKITVKNSSVDEAKDFLISILKGMKVNAELEIEEEEKQININIKGSSMGTVIGYRGETLDSLQYLVSLVLNKNHEETYKRVVLDAESYRKKRTDTLKRVAEKTAYKVRNSRRAYKLEPMNPYERRIIHAALQGVDDIYTFSEGTEPHRRVVVDIKRN